VVQIDGRRKTIRDAAGVREKFGVSPPLIPDLLALVGDAADGYPGIPGIGARTAAQLLNRYGKIENFPRKVLGEQREFALLFKKLATLRTDAPLFKKVETLRWRGPTPAFAKWAKRMKAPRLLERCKRPREGEEKGKQPRITRMSRIGPEAGNRSRLFGILSLESRFGQGEHHVIGVLRVFSFLIMNESVFP